MTVAANTFSAAFEEAARRNETRQAVRLVRDGEPLADEAAAIAAVRKHLDENGVEPKRLAKALDVAPSLIRGLFATPATIPDGPRHTLIRDASRWCRADAEERRVRKAAFVPTACTRLVVGLARVVRETRTIGLVVGGPGLGKSHALAVAAAELPGETVLVRCDTDSRSAKGILRAVGFAGAAALSSVARPSVKAGVEAVRAGNGLVAVDEAQLLGVNGLEALRAVFDQAGVGLLLVGTTSLARSLNGGADPLCGPLVSRIALRVDLDDELLGGGRNWIDAAALLLTLANGDPAHLRCAVDTAKVARVLARNRDGHDGGGAVSLADVQAALRMRRKDG
ncbi:MAG: AAA family ATPase [Phycisphaerae bacterium]|jgi:hypothetical protein